MAASKFMGAGAALIAESHHVTRTPAPLRLERK